VLRAFSSEYRYEHHVAIIMSPGMRLLGIFKDRGHLTYIHKKQGLYNKTNPSEHVSTVIAVQVYAGIRTINQT
jgi:hypothetical protein